MLRVIFSLDRDRPATPCPPQARQGGFAEVELGFDAEKAQAEGQRCISCSLCCQCGECARKCGPQAIDLSEQERIRTLDVGAYGELKG